MRMRHRSGVVLEEQPIRETLCNDTPSVERCPLCYRPLGTVNIDEHHLIPKSMKGKEKEKCHRVCHDKIHATFTERELANVFNSWQMLRENEEIGKFVKWVQKKPPEFLDKPIESNRRNGKRRR